MKKDDKTCKKNNKIRIAAVTTSCHKKYARRRPYLTHGSQSLRKKHNFKYFFPKININ